MALIRPFLEPTEGKVGAIHQKHRRALGERQGKGFLCRRCWKLLDGRDPFPDAQYGPGHTVGAQQTWVQQRCLVVGHPSAQWALWGDREERTSALQTGGVLQWGASDALAVCSFIHSDIYGASTPYQLHARHQGFNTHKRGQSLCGQNLRSVLGERDKQTARKSKKCSDREVEAIRAFTKEGCEEHTGGSQVSPCPHL